MRVRGLEPLQQKSQSIENTTLTENQNSVFAICLQKFPELEQLIQAWPKLPEHVKTEIKTMVESSKITEKEGQ